MSISTKKRVLILTARDFTLIFADYRTRKGTKLSKEQVFASINTFKKILQKYDEDFVKYMLDYAMKNEDFYSPKYLFLLADKLKPIYEKETEETLKVETEYKEVELPKTDFCKPKRKNIIEDELTKFN